MAEQVSIAPGIAHLTQNLLVDWINRKLPMNDRYTSFIRVGEIAQRISTDKKLKDDWNILDEMKKIHIEIQSDEESLREAHFGEYGYFENDNMWGGENPSEYIAMLKQRIKNNKKKREVLATKISMLIYSAFKGTEIVEEKLKKVFDQALGIYKEKEKIWK